MVTPRTDGVPSLDEMERRGRASGAFRDRLARDLEEELALEKRYPGKPTPKPGKPLYALRTVGFDGWYYLAGVAFLGTGVTALIAVLTARC